jgi:hypothetical protein
MTAPAKPNETDEKGIASGITVEIKGRIKSFKKVQPKNDHPARERRLLASDDFFRQLPQPDRRGRG